MSRMLITTGSAPLVLVFAVAYSFFFSFMQFFSVAWVLQNKAYLIAKVITVHTNTGIVTDTTSQEPAPPMLSFGKPGLVVGGEVIRSVVCDW